MPERGVVRRRRLIAAAVVAVLALLAPAGAIALGAKTTPGTTASRTATAATSTTATTPTKATRTTTTTTSRTATTTATTTTTAARTTTTAAQTATTAAHTATTAAHTATTAAHPTTKAGKSSTPSSHKSAARAQPQAPLTGWLGGGTTFPARALVLAPPATATLTTSRIHLTENGSPISSFTLTPVSEAQPGDFGVMLAIDQSSGMTGTGIDSAMSAASAFGSLLTAGQELGAVTFDSTATLYLPLTADPVRIRRALASVPWTSAGSDPGLAVIQAIGQLTQANVALGAVVLVSDGSGLPGTGAEPSPASIAAAAAASHTQVIVVGLEDHAATAASLKALRTAVPGQYVAVAPSGLSAVLRAIHQGLARDEVLRYRSHAALQTAITVRATADGVSGAVDVGYRSPQRPVVHHAAAAPVSHAQTSTTPAIARTGVLSGVPSFATSAPASGQAAGGFWASSAAVLVIAGICAALLALALALALRQPGRNAARMRVGSFIPVPGEDDAGSPAGRRGRSALAFPGRSWWTTFIDSVAVSRSRYTPVELVRRAAVMAVVAAGLLVWLTGSWMLAALALIGWPVVLRAFVKRAAEKQRAKFRDTLPSYLQDLASSMRVGRSFIGALAIVAASADEPTRSELERAVTDESLGRPLEECIDAVAARMESTDMGQVSLIAGLNRLSGSNVAESLDRVAEGSRERADVRREMRALTAQAKMSSMVLTGLPGVLLLGLSIVSPQYAHPLLYTTTGLCALGTGAVMVLLGWRVMKKITDVGEF
ncbi:MAG: type II secretion system F family protein [Solirubrobacteraceae bacterium]